MAQIQPERALNVHFCGREKSRYYLPSHASAILSFETSEVILSIQAVVKLRNYFVYLSMRLTAMSVFKTYGTGDSDGYGYREEQQDNAI